MGQLEAGQRPLDWEDAKAFAAFIKEHGIAQLIQIFHRLKDRTGDRLQWGDEIEYMVIKLDPATCTARLSLRSAEILHDVGAAEEKTDAAGSDPSDFVTWHPEYANYMLEATPRSPYEGSLLDFTTVEHNMAVRRSKVRAFLKDGEALFSITNFPRLGCPDFTEPPCAPNPDGLVSQSQFLPDVIINPHPRFPTLTANIRRRRGSTVAINVPVFHDKHTPSPFIERLLRPTPAALPDHVYLDAMGFGMGCCCLQVTFQACSLSEARYLYDQLAVVAPLFLALSAGAPIFRGILADVDCRWNVIAGSVDDRTLGERGVGPLQPGERLIRKSRYDSIDSYLGGNVFYKDSYNDLPLEFDADICTRLQENGA